MLQIFASHAMLLALPVHLPQMILAVVVLLAISLNGLASPALLLARPEHIKTHQLINVFFAITLVRPALQEELTVVSNVLQATSEVDHYALLLVHLDNTLLMEFVLLAIPAANPAMGLNTTSATLVQTTQSQDKDISFTTIPVSLLVLTVSTMIILLRTANHASQNVQLAQLMTTALLAYMDRTNSTQENAPISFACKTNTER